MIFHYRTMAALLLCSAMSSLAQEVCAGFSSGSVGPQHIVQEYTSAVVKVQDIGTAYLVDSEQGYLLTAGHVIDELVVANKPREIIRDDPSTTVKFKIIERSKTADIALIQL